jgi:hypothetical protein
LSTKAVSAADAVTIWCSAFTNLAALDQLLNDAPGFGAFPAIVPMRHAIACPDLTGTLQSDVLSIIESAKVEG